MSCGSAPPFFAWTTRRPVVLSDTADGLLINYSPAQFIHNRSSSDIMMNVRFQGGTSSPMLVSSADSFQGGFQWVGINETGTSPASGEPYETILATAANSGGNFGNQPANDAVEVVSSSASDTTRTVTIYGTTNGSDTTVAETVTLNGTTAVATTKTDWGIVLGVELSGVTVGTITIREASGDATITTIAPTSVSAGVQSVASSPGSLNAGLVVVVAAGATSKQIGLVGTAPAGTVQYDSQTLAGATPVQMNRTFGSVTKVLTGDLATATTVTVSNGCDLLAFY